MSAINSWSSRWIKVDRFRSHYVEAGDGEPVILVHGGGPGASGPLEWRYVIPALAQHFRVLAIDMLGFGETDKPTGLMYSHQDQVDHLANFIDTLCLSKVKLAGSSMGAYVAAKYALDHPDNVHRIFLIGSASIAQAMGLQAPEHLKAWQALRDYDGTEKAMRSFLEGIMMEMPNDAWIQSRTAIANLPGAREARDAMRVYNQRLKEDPNLLQRFLVTHRLTELTIPIQMLWGSEDRFAPVELAHQLQTLLPNVRVDILENAGHQCHNDMSSAKEFNRRAISFFGISEDINR